MWPAALPTVGPSEAAGDGGVIYLAELGAYLDLQIWTLKGTAAVAAAGAAALSLELACLPMKDYVFPPVFAPQKEGDCPGLGVYAGIIGEYTHTSLGLCRAACASAAVQRPPAPNRGVSRRRLRSSGCGTMGATSLRSDKPTHPTPPPSSAAPTPQAVLGAALVDGGRDLHVLVNAGVERKGAPDPDTGAWWLRVAVGRGGGEKAPKVKKQRLLAAPDAGDSLLYAALGLDAKGKQGLVVFTVTGANHYPSPGFSVIRGGKPRKDVYIVAEGVADACDGNQRWGDYHTVRMDEEGNFYGNVEWIASNVGGGGVRSAAWRTRKRGILGRVVWSAATRHLPRQSDLGCWRPNSHPAAPRPTTQASEALSFFWCVASDADSLPRGRGV